MAPLHCNPRSPVQHPRPLPWARIGGLAGTGALVAALVTGCSTAPTGPSETSRARLPDLDAAMTKTTGRGRWVRGVWSELPGWGSDEVVKAWPALLKSCQRLLSAPSGLRAAPASNTGPSTPSPDMREWIPACRAAWDLGPQADEIGVRMFLTERLAPWRIEAADGSVDGKLTGYFEPILEASRTRTARFLYPLYAPPAGLTRQQPWFSRQDIEALPQAQAQLAGREIAWLADPMDALMLHIQGSGRLLISSGQPQKAPTMVRVAFAGHNGQPYRSVGKWLVEQGAFTVDRANWPAIRAWARAHPERVSEMLAVNPRYVFFRDESMADPQAGALGAQGVPLTPQRSIAVDRESVPYGTPVWLSSTEPTAWTPKPGTTRPLQRLVVAQDTGSAIVGAVRADYYWGWGDGIEERAGRTNQPLRMWALWPR